jgi:threonine dehydratase
MSAPDLSLADVRAAARRIAGLACRTPLKPSLALTRRLARPVHLKLESMQDTGAFKVRGAGNMILNLPERARRRGVVAVSSGNHGRAVAHVARHLGIPAVVCLTRLVPGAKVAGVEALGAEVHADAADQAEATRQALALAEDRGLTYVDPFDQRDVIGGQGTVGLEILEQRPSVDTIVVPVGGGGLIAGIGVAGHALQPSLRLIGVTNDREPAMYESLKAGRIVPVGESPTLADALPGALSADNQWSFRLCQQHVEQIRLVDETAIERGMAWAFRREKLYLEGSGAIGIARLLAEATPDLGADVVVVCSGDNVDARRLLDVVERHPEP